MVKSIENADHYTWGSNCDGWHLLKSDRLSIIQERMPSGTVEQMHFHSQSQQVFYILSGEATFKIESDIFRVNAGESIHIPNLTIHSIANRAEIDLDFLVISEPKSHGDRINI